MEEAGARSALGRWNGSVKARYDRRDIRRLNMVSALNQLREGGPLSRAQVAERLGLTRATVSNIVEELLALSLVRESELEEGGRGRRGRLVDLNPSCGAIVAVDLDIDRVVVALANVGLRFLWRGELPLAEGATAEEGLRRAEGLVGEALGEAERLGLPCLGIGVAWAGLVDRASGELAYGPISGWERVPLGAAWEGRFGVGVHVENEAHAGAMAARQFGGARREDDLLYLSLGVGLSVGAYVNGALVRGSRGFAGQVGHTPFRTDGERCECGRRGCWVSEIGATAVLRKLRAAGVDLARAGAGGLDWVEEVCRLADAGDERTRAVLEEEGRQVGEGLARLAQAFNPSRIVVGGHLRALLLRCEAAIRASLRRAALSPMGEGVRVEVSDSDEDRLRGCVAAVFEALMNDPSLMERARRR